MLDDRPSRVRRQQAREAARPRHHQLAQLVATRLAGRPQDSGISDVDHVLRPVDAEEAHLPGLAAGWPMPHPIARVVTRAAAGTPEQLIDCDVIASAEVLARLTPRLAAATAASADLGQAAVAGVADAGDRDGLVDGAFTPARRA